MWVQDNESLAKKESKYFKIKGSLEEENESGTALTVFPFLMSSPLLFLDFNLRKWSMFMRQKKNDYYWGLIYCTQNDIENAYFYLNRAANAGNEVAIQTLKELKEKNLLSKQIQEKR